jgi:tetratricopeptide (TPR) repeat protein
LADDRYASPNLCPLTLSLIAASIARVQDRLGDRFVLQGLLGQGGMGTVYRALDERSGSAVAIKLLSTTNAQAEARFHREAEALACVSHPGIVRYIAHGRAPDGQPYLAMEWIEGEDLCAHLERGPLDVKTALRLAGQLVNALAVVHAQGVIHRDIKPQNVLLSQGDPLRPVLVDFGVARQTTEAKLTVTGTVLGTPQYMAPEQIQGGQVDARLDLFALGCVLYECLSAQPAFSGEHVVAVLAKILVERPQPLSDLGIHVPSEVESLMLDLLAKPREHRPANAMEVARRIDACLEALAAAPNRSSLPPAIAKLTAREQRAVAVVMATQVGCVSGHAETVTPEEAARQAEPIESLVAPHAGQLWTLGQGRILITFAGAEEATDQAARAARCALSLRDRYADANFALAVGWAQVDRVPVGEAIDRAAAQLLEPHPGCIRVDAASAGLLELRFRLKSSGDQLELLGELESAERPRTLVGRPTPCVGRERELSMLQASLEEVMSEGTAHVVLITGPSGAGKSRIRHELLDRARRGEWPLAIYVARAEQLRAGSPLDLLGGLLRAAAGIQAVDGASDARDKLVALVRRRVPGEAERVDVAEFLGELAGTPFPDEASERLRAARADARLMGAHLSSAFSTWLDAETRAQAVMLVLDDLQWGDAQTIKLLDNALRDLAERPLMIVALARPEVHERFPGLWKTRGLSELKLAGLGAKACARLVHEVLGSPDETLVERIVAHAGGNALYLEELIRAASQGSVTTLPVSVLAMVQARLEALAPTARRILRAASIFGATFRRDAIRALIGPDGAIELEQELEALSEREIIGQTGAGGAELGFRHAQVREAAYAMLTEQDKQLGHGLAAAWLESNGETDARLLAQHYDRARDQKNAARCYARAAHQAVEKNDFEAALVMGQRALDLGPSASLAIEARLMRGKALASLGRLAEAESELDAALAIAPEEAAEQRMEVLREMFFVGSMRQWGSALRRAGTEAMSLATTHGRKDLQAEAHAALAIADHAEERCDQAVSRFRQAVEQLGDRPSSVVGLSGILLYHAGLHGEAEVVDRRMLKSAIEMRDYGTAVILQANLAVSVAALGRYEEAREQFAVSRAEAERCGLSTLYARTVSLSVGHRLDVLDLDGAAALAQQACELGKAMEFSTPRISSSIDLGFIAIRRGDAAEAARILDAIAPAVQKGTGFHGWLWRERTNVLRAELALLRGELADALSRADASIEECRRHRRLKYQVIAQIVRARALVALAQKDVAADELLELLGRCEKALDPSLALRVGLALLAISRESKAETVVTERATRIEAALPAADRATFRAALETALRAG